jgi:seryl-tRNA synthetase
VNERVKAEMEASEAAKKRAETVAQGRDFMDRQVQEMQEKHQDMLRRNSALEKELTASKTSVSELQAEVSTLRERLVQTEAAAEQASGMHAILHEMDELRVQLRTLRSEKLRRGIEEDAGVIAPKAVIDRVEESKQVRFLCLF